MNSEILSYWKVICAQAYFSVSIYCISVTGVHPRLVNEKIGKPQIREAMEHFPEWNEKEVIAKNF